MGWVYPCSVAPCSWYSSSLLLTMHLKILIHLPGISPHSFFKYLSTSIHWLTHFHIFLPTEKNKTFQNIDSSLQTEHHPIPFLAKVISVFSRVHANILKPKAFIKLGKHLQDFMKQNIWDVQKSDCPCLLIRYHKGCWPRMKYSVLLQPEYLIQFIGHHSPVAQMIW